MSETDRYNYTRNIFWARVRHVLRLERNRNITRAVIIAVFGSTTFDNMGVSFTWIQFHGSSATPVAAVNPTTLNVEGTPVLAARNPKKPHVWTILGADHSRVRGATYLSRYEQGIHGDNHSIPDENAPGPDPAYMYQPNIMMLKTVGDGATLTVSTHHYIYTKNGQRRLFYGADTDLTSSVPGAGLIRKVLLYLDRDTNILEQIDGTTVADDGMTPVPEPAPPVGIDARESAWIYLSNGQTFVATATHVEDARDFLDNASASSLPAATEYGQVLMSNEALAPFWATPLIADSGGWMTDEDGHLMIDE
jgi:hypothetical protein